MNKKIASYYTPYQANTYEAQRRNEIWENENSVFCLILNRVMQASKTDCISILDLPVGTGRWIPFVETLASRYVGVDISENMLNEARGKLCLLTEGSQRSFSLLQCGYSELNEKVHGKYYLVVSTRFLPHFDIEEVQTIVNALVGHSEEWLLFMVRVFDTKLDGIIETVKFVTLNPFGAMRRYRKAGRLSYSKERKEYIEVFNVAGLNLVSCHLVHNYGHSKFEYWLLRKR